MQFWRTSQTATGAGISVGLRAVGKYDMAPWPTPCLAAADERPMTVELLNLEDDELLARCQMDTYRASGPGGQKRNKTDSAVRLRLTGTELLVIATESRSQHENRARALRRMRRAIALSQRRPVDLDSYRPSEMLAGCLVGGTRLTVGLRDRRYWLVAAEVLDVLLASQMRLSDVASLLGITTGNLSAFVMRDPKLADQVNRLRRQAGLKTLR